jgi:hypothetical protein
MNICEKIIFAYFKIYELSLKPLADKNIQNALSSLAYFNNIRTSLR